MSGNCIQCQSPCHPMGDLCDNCANQLEPIASLESTDVADEFEAHCEAQWERNTLESTDGGYSFNYPKQYTDEIPF